MPAEMMPDDPSVSHVGSHDVNVVGMRLKVVHSDMQQSTVLRITEELGNLGGLTP